MLFYKLFPLFKYGIYGLLLFNIYLFFRHATIHEGLDCVGWVLLLAIFEWETRKDETASSFSEKTILLLSQAMGYGLVLYAWTQYYLHEQWLDFINASLWLAVVVILWRDVHADHGRSRRKRWSHFAFKSALYGGLLTVAVIWGVQGSILNFYDAFLWILCFFAIEMNLLQHFRHRWQHVRS